MFKICKIDEKYSVSETGEVKSLFTGKLLKQSVSKRGYLVVNVRVNGKRRPYPVHKLVAEAYLPVVEGKSHVNHIDGDKLNNHKDNLEWCNDLENKEHAWATGLMKRGQDCSKNGLTEEVVKLICSKLESGMSVGDILKSLPDEPVNRSTILNIRSRRSWKHISINYKWELKTKFRNKKASTLNDQ